VHAASVETLLQRIDDRTAKVVLVGQGYVGLPVAMRVAEVGMPVVGFDTSPTRVDALRAALQSGYVATDDPADIAGFDITVITVPTPLREGVPDLTFIESAAEVVAGHLRPGALVVLESTTYPGTTAELVGPILERGSGLRSGE
jgi:UDP-N-acetyl-D-mannosaminuronate dehydrogenase